MLVDSFHRNISYLRLSVTDRCNLRCRYCMPANGVAKLDHDEILTYEEFLRVASAAAAEGMTKIRLTGGEPLIRKEIVEFIRSLAAIPGIMDLRLTTNGVLLGDMAPDLLSAGIRRVNISLDSLNRETFRFLSGRDDFDRVKQSIKIALETGFDRIKINCVPIRGINDHEVLDFARLTLDHPVEVRFIEFMPLGINDYWTPEKMVPTEEIKRQIGELGQLTPKPRNLSEGPAQVYQLPDAAGSVGFISPVTDHFCKTCNRLRLTADGKLRLCLFSNEEIDLKNALRRENADQAEIAGILRRAVADKPQSHPLELTRLTSGRRPMSRIGG